MGEEFPSARFDCMRYFIGDVRGKDRLVGSGSVCIAVCYNSGVCRID